MVSHQLVYVTGMLEVILAPSDSSGGSKRVAELSEASETFSGAFLSFPTRRKRSAARFDVFRGLGWGANMRRRAFPAHPAYLCRRLSGIWMCGELSDTMSDYYLLLRDYSNYYL